MISTEESIYGAIEYLKLKNKHYLIDVPFIPITNEEQKISEHIEGIVDECRYEIGFCKNQEMASELLPYVMEQEEEKYFSLLENYYNKRKELDLDY